MKLDHLLGILKGGNKALERKLNGILSEDCTIVEYTDDAVLFIKENKLVLARVKNAVTESAFTPDNILDTELVYINKSAVQDELKEHLMSVITDLADENLVDARNKMSVVESRFYQYGVLSNLYPNLFAESLARHAKGFPIRKRALCHVPEFRGAIYSAAALTESADVDVVTALEIIAEHGIILTLGRTKIFNLISEALRGNDTLAQKYTDTLFEMAKDMPDANDDLNDALEGGYDLEAGGYPDESPEDIENEDYSIDTDEELATDVEGGDANTNEAPEFEPFDPAKLSPEEARELHVKTLSSILSTIHDFVVDKSNDPEDTTVDVDMDTKISDDLAKLEQPDITDDDLADIEGRWNPVIDYFLDSDVHRAEEDEFSLPAEAAENPDLTGEAETVSDVGIGDNSEVSPEEVAPEGNPEAGLEGLAPEGNPEDEIEL